MRRRNADTKCGHNQRTHIPHPTRTAPNRTAHPQHLRRHHFPHTHAQSPPKPHTHTKKTRQPRAPTPALHTHTHGHKRPRHGEPNHTHPPPHAHAHAHPVPTHLHVGNGQRLAVEVLLERVGLGVLDDLGHELDGVLGPASLCDTPLVLLALGLAADIALEAAVRDDLLVRGAVTEVAQRLVDLWMGVHVV